MNKAQNQAFEMYYNNQPIDTIRKTLHRSTKTILAWISDLEFDRLGAERSQIIIDKTTKELISAKLDIIQTVKNSFQRKTSQTNVWGDVVNTVPLDSSKDIKALTDCITALDGTSKTPSIIVNTGTQVDTVQVDDAVLREIGKRLAADDESATE